MPFRRLCYHYSAEDTKFEPINRPICFARPIMLNFLFVPRKTRNVKKKINQPRVIPGGLLIAFEGIDGSGKTTMARRTALMLQQQGYNAVYLCEPTDGPHGRELRKIMKSPNLRDPQREFELFLLDRQKDVHDNIQPVLNAGGVVCIDRYYVSSMAYQGALGLDPAAIRRENEKFAPVPHLILWYSLPVAAALKRILASRVGGANQFEKQDYLELVNQEFHRMDFPQMIKLDSMQDQDAVFQETCCIVTAHISNCHTDTN